MRIAFVTYEFLTEKNFDGGLANYIYRVCLSLLQLGHVPLVVVASDKDEILYYSGIEVHRVRVNNRWISLLNRLTKNKFLNLFRWTWQSWKLNQKIKQIHAKQSLNVIQYASDTGLGAFRPSNISSIVRLSSYQPLWREAYGCISISTDQKLGDWLERRAFKKVDALFGPSEIIALTVEKVTGKKVHIIETPFKMDVLKTDERPYNDLLVGKDYLLFFGSIGQLKGVPLIAEIVDELLASFPHLFFVFVGKDLGYQGIPMMEYLWNKAGSHRGRILWLGKMRHEQLYPILRNAIAVVLPSRIDNMPNTCLEAMAHKKVVIGTKGTSFEQLLIDGVNGYLCERDNPQSLLATVMKVLHLNVDDRIQVGEKAFERILKLSPDKVVNQLVQFYEEVIFQHNEETLKK